MKKLIKNELDGRYGSTNLQMVYSGKEKKKAELYEVVYTGSGEVENAA